MCESANPARRLCVYVTYNKEHKVKEYMGHMLKSLRKCVTSLYVVCNYPEILDGYDYIRPYADAVFRRENKGFDAGAYKDMICTLLGWDTIYKYDEIILANDSFLGPFYSLNGYFDMMSDVPCDFWGMTRNFGGEYKESIIGKYESHVQSYFVVCRERLLHSSDFRDFWEKFVYPNTYDEAILYFEHAINHMCRDKGFNALALTDVWGLTFEKDVNPYRAYAFELIRDYKLPLLKKKSIQIHNMGFPNAIKAVDFIEAENLYPSNLIWEAIDSQFYIENYAPGEANCLEQFCNKFSKIYIYGAGVCGKNLVLYFEKKGWKLDGILVSDKAEQDIACMAFEEAEIDDETGIIVSVRRKNVSEEIVRYIEKNSNCKREQLFVIYDCKALRVPHTPPPHLTDT